MSFGDFLNSNRSYELFVKSSGLEFNEKSSKKWTVQRVLIRGIIIFAECFCLKNKIARVAMFRVLSCILNEYAQEIENSKMKKAF